MTSLAAPLSPSATLRGGGRWIRLLRRLTAAAVRPAYDASLRAGAERPATPMLISISLGGAARLR